MYIRYLTIVAAICFASADVVAETKSCARSPDASTTNSGASLLQYSKPLLGSRSWASQESVGLGGESPDYYEGQPPIPPAQPAQYVQFSQSMQQPAQQQYAPFSQSMQQPAQQQYVPFTQSMQQPAQQQYVQFSQSMQQPAQQQYAPFTQSMQQPEQQQYVPFSQSMQPPVVVHQQQYPQQAHIFPGAAGTAAGSAALSPLEVEQLRRLEGMQSEVSALQRQLQDEQLSERNEELSVSQQLRAAQNSAVSLLSQNRAAFSSVQQARAEANAAQSQLVGLQAQKADAENVAAEAVKAQQDAEAQMQTAADALRRSAQTSQRLAEAKASEDIELQNARADMQQLRATQAVTGAEMQKLQAELQAEAELSRMLPPNQAVQQPAALRQPLATAEADLSEQLARALEAATPMDAQIGYQPAAVQIATKA